MIRGGVAAESGGDATRVTRLADRVVAETREPAPMGTPAPQVVWGGIDGAAWLDIHLAWRLARARNLRIKGRFSGEAPVEDAESVRAVLLLFAESDPQPRAVVVSRDVDGRPARIEGLEQAANSRVWPFEVLGALADPEIEAWCVAAFVPASKQENDALLSVRRRLGFDPTLYPERLTSGSATQKKDAKRTLDELNAGGRDADERLQDAPLTRLRERGQRCGLTRFIEQVETRLGPLLDVDAAASAEHGS